MRYRTNLRGLALRPKNGTAYSVIRIYPQFGYSYSKTPAYLTDMQRPQFGSTILPSLNFRKIADAPNLEVIALVGQIENDPRPAM